MFKLVKGDQVKYQADDRFFKELKAEGWTVEGEYEQQTVKKNTQKELYEKAKKLGLNPHHLCGATRLRKMIEDANGNC